MAASCATDWELSISCRECGYRVAMDTASAREEQPLEPVPYGPLPGGFGPPGLGSPRPADEAEAKAVASPLRLRILRITLHEPHTNKEIAEALELNPASVLHHVRTLVDTGFLIEQPVRRGPRGSRERPYLASGKTLVPRLRRTRPAGDGQDLLLADLPRGDQGPPGRRSSTAPGWASGCRAEDRRAGVRPAAWPCSQEIAAMPSDPEGEPWSLYLGLHPDSSGVPSGHALDRDH